MLYNGVDSAYPGAPLPAGTQILCAYVGGKFLPGAPDTPHIWTTDEWNGYYEDHSKIRMLPIYVHNYPGDPVECADNAVNAVTALGWAANMPGDERRIIVLDMEIFVAPAYVHGFIDRASQRGFATMVYGSWDFVVRNPPGIGYWMSHLLPHAPSILPPNAQGVQWRYGAQWDYNVFSSRVWNGCGQGPRK
jgi:hypothetical protein